MATSYPNGIDDFDDVDGSQTLGEAKHSDQHNNANAAIKAIQTHVGTANPATGLTQKAEKAAEDATKAIDAIGTPSDAPTKNTVYGSIAKVAKDLDSAQQSATDEVQAVKDELAPVKELAENALAPAPGQSNNPVTVWATPKNPDGTHTGGQNIQFQWDETSVPDVPTLRCHVDAEEGKPGRAYFDLAWLPNDIVSIGVFGEYKDTRYAVGSGALNGQNHDLLMAYNWTDGTRFLIAENGRHVGQLRVELPSTAAAKENLRKAGLAKTMSDGPDYVGFFEAVDVYDYSYLPEEAYPANGGYGGTSHVGFVADWVADAVDAFQMPDGVVTRDENGDPDGVSDRDMVAVLWQVVKEQQAQIADLTSRVEALEP